MNAQSDNDYVQPYAYVILAICFLASMAGAASMFQVPPMATTLMQEFGADESLPGLLMSSFSMAGLILALPGGFICKRFGIKKTIVASVAIVAAGSLMGAFATEPGLLYVSRFIEGMGTGILSLAAPAGISAWFPESKRGFPLGLWSIWMPFSSLIMLNTAPALAAAFGWRSIWYEVAIFAIFVLVAFVILFKMPPGEDEGVLLGIGGTFVEGLADLKNKNLWLVGVSFGFFNLFLAGIFANFYPAYIETQAGFPNSEASSIASITTLLSIISPLVGFISDKLDNRKGFMIVGTLAFIVLSFFIFRVTTLPSILAVVTIAGVLGPVVTVPARVIIPRLMHGSASAVSMGMSTLAFCQNVGVAIGSALFGIVVAGFSWQTAGMMVVLPALVIALIPVFLVQDVKSKGSDNV